MEFTNPLGIQITDLVDTILQWVESIGYMGPIILSILALYFLRNNSKYFVIFVLGQLVNYYANKSLKSILKQPRPQDSVWFPFIKKNVKDGYEDQDNYGMPSGHAQLSFFAIAYVYWVRRSTNILFPMFLLGFISLYQGRKYRRHTVEQLIIGALIGMLIAYGFFLGANTWK